MELMVYAKGALLQTYELLFADRKLASDDFLDHF